MAGGQVYPVEAPVRRPKFGRLLDSAVEIPTTDERWITGVSFEPPQCDAAQLRAGCSTAAYDDLADVCIDAITFRPYEVIGEYRHSAFGLASRDGWALARDNLDVCESSKIENELWTAAATPGNPSLDNNTDLTHLGGPYTPDEALERLIATIGTCGCDFVHFIHASPRVTAAWFDGSYGLLERVGRTFYTHEGHVVVSGAGYPGTGPDGSDPPGNNQYAFASGPVDLRRGPVHDIGRQPDNPNGENAGVIIRQENLAVFRSMRYAVATFNPECCRLAVEVTLAADVVS